MGITGLLPYLADATRQCHISEFRGGTVAVDSYCFLHKGANACVEQLARGEDSHMYVTYCLKYVKMLLSYNIHPIMVFDGRNLPAKAETEAKRRESRKKAKHRAAELLNLGKTDEARTYLKQCIDITPKMAHNLIIECRKINVDCIVAPYESDAQLAFFNVKGVAEFVITEDSDLLLFGCKKVLYKLDLSGVGRLVESDKICSAMKMRPDHFTFDKFRFMCILSGCDYANSLSGIGLKKAEKFFKLTAETNPEVFLDRIPRYLNMKHLVVTEEYKQSVLIANATFLHQVVFDPYKKKLVHLTDPEVKGTNIDHLINAGDKFDDEKALQVALGNLDPYSFEKYDDWTPSQLPEYSIWSGIYKKRISRKQERELQKTQLQKFMKKETIIEESRKIEELEVEESQISKELSRYTSRLEITTEIKAESHCELVENKTELSPVLVKNPFLRNKKISKFPKTYAYGNAVVKSRFFSPQSQIEVKQSNDSECENDHEIVMEESTSIQHTSAAISVNTHPVLQPCENIAESVSRKRSSDHLIQIETTQDDLKGSNQVELQDVKSLANSKQASDKVNETKKRKLGPCRPVGLKKVPSSQKTLHSFFGKLKKPV